MKTGNKTNVHERASRNSILAVIQNRHHLRQWGKNGDGRAIREGEVGGMGRKMGRKTSMRQDANCARSGEGGGQWAQADGR